MDKIEISMTDPEASRDFSNPTEVDPVSFRTHDRFSPKELTNNNNSLVSVWMAHKNLNKFSTKLWQNWIISNINEFSRPVYVI